MASKVDGEGRPLAGSDLIYLEDFDFRDSRANLDTANRDGVKTLHHIHLFDSDAADATNGPANTASFTAQATAALTAATAAKTAQQGVVTTATADVAAKEGALATAQAASPLVQADVDAAQAALDAARATKAAEEAKLDTLTRNEADAQAYVNAIAAGSLKAAATFDPFAITPATPEGANIGTTARGTVATGNTTKTEFVGTEAGTALVYGSNVRNYIQRSERLAKEFNEVEQAQGTAAAITAHANAKNVAEVYGHRTFVEGDSLTGAEVNSNVQPYKTNAPYLPRANDRLVNVQYGRVTSSLNGLNEADLRKGKEQGELVTRIASYATFGSEGSENSYFFRGVNATADATSKSGSNLVTALKDIYTDGKIQYAGHAVTYGFNHSYAPAGLTGPGVPNAIGTTAVAGFQEVSGTHVNATVDLNTYNVTGRLFDKFERVGNSSVKVENNIATFSGTLTSNGNVEGTSVRVADNAEGSFKATLYGTTASELGGGISSHDTTSANSWGAVFGAKQYNGQGIGVGTDSNSRGQ